MELRERIRGVRKRSRWVYVLPLIHLSACLISYSGLVIRSLDHLLIIFTFILLIDLPVSLPAYALGWGYPAIAVVWVVITGTLYWYLLSRGIEMLVERHKIKIASGRWPPSINQSASAKDKVRS
jgi:hypothetical protein